MLRRRKEARHAAAHRILLFEAIVKELRQESFVLWGQGQAAAAAIAYAVKFPDRVSHLILSNPWTSVSFRALGGDVSLDTFRALVLSNSRMASLAIAEAVLGNSFDASGAAMVLPHPAGKRDARNVRSAGDETIVGHGREELISIPRGRRFDMKWHRPPSSRK
jgi:pimeloyl-ACP methyl ester carboxylesterase